ncbi:hypothetical protein BD779DRAFT_1502799 [Infundibulicybe gibba]|nr:hypothetical protein BD779DRAFT_1502799 [Infundibulicybe gibba]
MAMSVLTPLVQIFQYSLTPIAPFTWFGLGINTIDVVAAFRLCIVLRQIKDRLHQQHIATKGRHSVEAASFVKNLSTTLTVVYGGEAITGPFLGLPPSFMLSGVVPALYATVQAVVDILPSVPDPSPQLEIPLAIVDGFTRTYLVCSLIPPSVTANASPSIASSPWTLLLTSLITANGGFFLTNLFSFLNPTPLTVQTPPELQAYGWTTADLWCAPLATGLYALLTHAQPFWGDAHSLIVALLGGAYNGKEVEAVDPEVARAVCALLLSTIFLGRTAKNFGLWKKQVGVPATGNKTKTQ